ncbi:hypothetical protein [uncultured Alistipes sp.]|uniref:hypothetical protein n=1 Tax=uncultured Alistipes sp. TaxID=538949 RepID=UPI00262B8272|nr:hypothetical protein [uncultured Alistipes sp.]
MSRRDGALVVLITLFFPALAFILSGCCLARSPKNWRAHVFCVALFFAVMSYGYVPLDETDLTRYFEYVEGIASRGFWETVTYVYENQTGLFVFNALAWVAGATHDFHLLPAISTFGVYYIGLYMTFTIFEREKFDYKVAKICLLFVLCATDWYAITNNVRNVLAFTLVSFAVFRDVYLRKRNLVTGMFYLLPITIHPTAVILILLRLVIHAAKKLKYVLLLSVALIAPMVEFLYLTVPSYTSNIFVNFLLLKSYNYFFDRGTDWGEEVSNSTYFGVHKFLYISMMVAFCLLAVRYREAGRKQSVPESRRRLLDFQHYVYLLALMAIACFPMLRPEYWRFTAVAFVCSAVLLSMCLQKKPKSLTEKLSLAYVFGLAPLCLCMWLYRLQYFDVADWIGSILTTCPVVSLIRDVYAI